MIYKFFRHATIIFIIFLIPSCGYDKITTLPSFEFTTIDGATITSEDLKGKATVLCVWATWCGDCIREIPELNALVKQYASSEDVIFLAMSDEDEDTVNKSLDKYPFDFVQVVEAKDYTDKLNTGFIKHFPQVLVIDKKLNVVFEVTENKAPIFEKLSRYIDQIIE